MAGDSTGQAPPQVAASVTESYGGVDGYAPALVARFRAAEEARSSAAAAARAAGGVDAAGTTRPHVRAPHAVSSIRICRGLSCGGNAARHQCHSAGRS